MTTALQTIDHNPLSVVPADVSPGALEMAIGRGDLSRLTSEDRLKYIGQICKWTGLNPLTKPIDIIDIKGKTVLYANKGCAEQLRQIHGISITITERAVQDGVYIVRAKARRLSDGREDEAIGAVPFFEKGSGDDRANAMMKSETKAKRRVTLSICGLGFMPDESELETMKPEKVADVLPTETTTDRAAMLSAAVEVEVVKAERATPERERTNNATELSQTSQVPAAGPTPRPGTPTAPVENPVEAPNPAGDAFAGPDGLLTAKTVAAIEAIMMASAMGPEKCVEYLTFKGKLTPGAEIAAMDHTAANYITKKPDGFYKMVEAWMSTQPK